jgi:hypothetical protein
MRFRRKTLKPSGPVRFCEPYGGDFYLFRQGPQFTGPPLRRDSWNLDAKCFSLTIRPSTARITYRKCVRSNHARQVMGTGNTDQQL